MLYLRHILCVAFLAFFAPHATPAVSTTATPNPALTSQPTASNLPEVRLRKLHLVRPDLIPYPIAYEVYC